MRLKTFEITPVIAAKYGLKPGKLERLQSVVAFVGRNGMGKTRALNALVEFLGAQHSPEELLEIMDDIPDPVLAIIKAMRPEILEVINAEHKARQGAALAQRPQMLRREDVLAKERLNRALATVNTPQAQRKVNVNVIKEKWESTTMELRRRVIRVPTTALTAMNNGGGGPKGRHQSNAYKTLISSKGATLDSLFTALVEGALPYLRELAHDLAGEYFENIEDLVAATKTPSYGQLQLLQQLVRKFLRKELSWNKRQASRTKEEDGVLVKMAGELWLEGRPFTYESLSEGEKILFAYAMFFFLVSLNKELKLEECIFLLDEPEVHLHPEAELAIVDSIREIIGSTGQLIIATHSINLLSHLDVREIFPITEGKFEAPSRSAVGSAVDELFGLEEHGQRLASFLGDISDWAFASFIEQCLTNPEVHLKAEDEDPECRLLIDVLKEDSARAVLLDFGAGQGRVSQKLFEGGQSLQNIDAVEPNDDFHERLNQVGIGSIYSSYENIPEGAYDVVFMCGVLHEIPVVKWLSAFQQIAKSLTPTGKLIIVEDTVLPRGEFIEEHGFLVLDELSLKCLFNTDAMTIFKDSNPKYTERILCAVVARKVIDSISMDSLGRALTMRREAVYDLYTELRKKRLTGADRLAHGRKLAFLTQQHLNLVQAERVLSGASQSQSPKDIPEAPSPTSVEPVES